VNRNERAKILDRLTALDSKAGSYFEAVRREFEGKVLSEPLFDEVPGELRAEAESLSREVGSLLQPALSLVRENPGFTPADYRDLGLSIRQMRSAVKLSHYHFSDIEVLHDEGRVLGVEPPRQWERGVGPSDAASVFGDAARGIRSILELAPEDVTVHGAPIPSPAVADWQNYRPGTAFIIMSMDPKNPELDDVCNAVKRCFAEFDIKAVRADDIEHEDLITARIIDEIRTAEFLFADLTGERPSVYYELGSRESAIRTGAARMRASSSVVEMSPFRWKNGVSGEVATQLLGDCTTGARRPLIVNKYARCS
jgi:hypothetical protein